MGELTGHPIFLAVFAMAVANGLIISLVIYYFPKLLGRQAIVIENDNGKKKTYIRFCVKDCPEHQAEHDRSLRNEERITKLETKFEEMKSELTAGLVMMRENHFYILLGLKEKGLIDLPQGYLRKLKEK